MKSEKFKYLLAIFVTTLFCTVKNGDCLPSPLLLEIHEKNAHRLQEPSLKSNDAVNSDSVSEILRFWKDQEDRMNIGFQKDVTLFLGTTGSGKSSVISLLTDNDLESVEIYRDSERFKIVDKLGRISQNSTILSQTLIPELIVDNEFAAYFDCPGFEDTRGIKYDITITYLIRKLLKFANSVKFVFVIAHSQVSEGGDRHGIIDLGKHVNGLVKNIDKFSNGIGLVVTKVENVAKISKKSIAFVDDNDTLNGIQRFLARAKSDLETMNRNHSLSTFEMKAHEGAIKFISILLRNGSDGQPNIRLFRKPLETGLLSNMAIFQSEKNAIKTLINEKLQFVQKENVDFGFTLSDASKNHAYLLFNEIRNHLAAHITLIGGEITGFYTNQEKDYKNLLVLYNEASALNNSLHAAKAEDPQLFAKYFVTTLESANVDRITEPLYKIQNYMDHIGFLTELTESSNLDLSQVTGAISKVIRNIDDYLDRLLGKIESGIVAQVFEQYDRIEQGISRAESEHFDLIYLKDLMVEAQKNLATIGDTNDMAKLLKMLFDSSIWKEVDPSPDSLINIAATIDFLNYSHVDLSTWCKLSISNEANNFAIKFEAFSRWYTFLFDLYERLSEMNLNSIQLSYNQIENKANDLMEELSIEGAQKINVSEIGLREFLDAIDIKTNYNVETLQINEFQSKALKTVLAMTIHDKIECSADGSTIFGLNVKMSDAIKLNCWRSSDNIKVFASDKVLIDVDIDRTTVWRPKQLSIVAPIWKVMGNRRINLNGKNAPNFESSASDGTSYSIDGEHGSDGKSGTPAGCFFGIGNKFIGGSMLSIRANGGDAGSGQNGGGGFYSMKEDYPVERTLLKTAFVVASSVLGFAIGGPPGAAIGLAGSGALAGTVNTAPNIVETIGRGGNGGAAGLAGHRGYIEIIDLKNDTLISAESIDGEFGYPGVGGYSSSWDKHGQDGANRYGIEIPSPAQKIGTQEKLQIIDEYKNVTEKFMTNNIRQTTLKNFIEEMDQSASRY